MSGAIYSPAQRKRQTARPTPQTEPPPFHSTQIQSSCYETDRIHWPHCWLMYNIVSWCCLYSVVKRPLPLVRLLSVLLTICWYFLSFPVLHFACITSMGRCALHWQESLATTHAASTESPVLALICPTHVLRGLPLGCRMSPLLSVVRLATRLNVDSQMQGGVGWNLMWKSTYGWMYDVGCYEIWNHAQLSVLSPRPLRQSSVSRLFDVSVRCAGTANRILWCAAKTGCWIRSITWIGFDLKNAPRMVQSSHGSEQNWDLDRFELCFG